jgi:hypothetical protein
LSFGGKTNMKRGREKRGKCEGIKRKQKNKGELNLNG